MGKAEVSWFARKMERNLDGIDAPLFLVSNAAVLETIISLLSQGSNHLREVGTMQLDVLLLDPVTRMSWRCLATFDEVRPAYLDPSSFAFTLRDVLGSRSNEKSAILGEIATALFPSWRLHDEPAVVRLEARAAAGGGNATLTVLVLHFSKSSDNARAWSEALSALTDVSTQLGIVASRAARAEGEKQSILAERDTLKLEKVSAEAMLLEASLKIINTKKAKIRELADLLDAANARISELEAPRTLVRSESSEMDQARRRQPSAEQKNHSGDEAASQQSDVSSNAEAVDFLKTKPATSTDQLLQLGL